MITPWRVCALVLGSAALWAAIGSPLTTLDHQSMVVHMAQHLLLAAVAPPLILLGIPRVEMWIAPADRRKLATVWFAASVTVLAWHVPEPFHLAQRSAFWQWIQRATFFSTGLLFWSPIVRPLAAASEMTRAAIPLYLFAATLPCDALSAFLVFCDRIVYHDAAHDGRVMGMSALADQQAAGALMWVSVTLIYLVPAVVLTVRGISPARAK